MVKMPINVQLPTEMVQKKSFNRRRQFKLKNASKKCQVIKNFYSLFTTTVFAQPQKCVTMTKSRYFLSTLNFTQQFEFNTKFSRATLFTSCFKYTPKISIKRHSATIPLRFIRNRPAITAG